MRRALVLTNEGAKHPFRQSLPAKALDTRAPLPVPEAKRNLRLFATTYATAFVGIYTFLS
jgi:hypothetical protein